jgi:GMP synthase-like glutamine amidotransferase
VSGDDGRPAVLVIQHHDDAGPGQLVAGLAAAGLRHEIWRPADGRPLPARLDSHAGLVVLGGRMSANDTASLPYLGSAKRLIADAADRGVPALGICLGAQLAAAAFGGRVTRRPTGPRIGWRAVAGGEADSLTAELVPGARLFYWHGDRYDPPAEAVQILDDWEAFRVGSVSAFQPHPEVTAEIIRAWCRTDGGMRELAEAGVSSRRMIDDAAVNDGFGGGILARWCLEVRAELDRASGQPAPVRGRA